MAIYKLVKFPGESEASSVTLDQGNGVKISIPLDCPKNRHFKDFLQWKAEGTTPVPAD